MGRGRKLEAAADHRAVHHCDNRHLTELDLVEHAVPEARVANGLFNAVRAQVGEVEAGREMIAVPVQHHRLHAFGQVVEERLDAEHGLVIERVALLGPVEPQDRDVAARFGVQRGW
jgi:hypothetical protein